MNRILVVDDEESTRILYEDELSEEGYDIISINMVKVIQNDEEMGIDSGHCNEELIL